VKKYTQSTYFIIALCLHILLAILLFLSLERTIFVSEDKPALSQKEIINAVVINKNDLQKEVARLEAVEAQKRIHEEEKKQKLALEEKEAKDKIIKAQELAAELEKKNEVLKLAQQQEQKKLEEKQQQQKAAAQAAKEKAKAKAEAEAKAAQAAKEQKKAEKEAQEAQEALEAQEAQRQQALQRQKQDEVTRHAQLIRSRINENWRKPLGFDLTGLKCKIDVKLLPTGEVLTASVIVSSGSVEFDRSAELAVRKASPLPMPEDPFVANAFRQFDFTFSSLEAA